MLSVVLIVAMSGGWGLTFDAAERALSTRDKSPATDLLLSSAGQWNYLTVIIGSALSIFAYPHLLTGILAAKDRNTIKRNAAALPIYVFALGLMAMLGVFAIAEGVLPVDADLARGFIGDSNTVGPMVFHTKFPPWSAGIAFATLAVAALIPAAIMSISTANLFTRCIYMEYFRPRATPAEEARVSRWVSLLVKFGAAGIIILLDPAFSTEFQLIGSIVILQILPAVFIGVMTGWLHRWALMIGMLVGLGTSVVLLYMSPAFNASTGAVTKEHFGGSSIPLSKLGLDSNISVYIGLITLAVNLLVVVILTAILKMFHVSPNLDHTRPEDYTADADVEGLDRLDQLLDGIPQKTGAHALR